MEEGGQSYWGEINANVTQQVNFDRPWADYEQGFGELNTESWKWYLWHPWCVWRTNQQFLQGSSEDSSKVWLPKWRRMDSHTEEEERCATASEFSSSMGRLWPRVWRSEHWVLVWSTQHPLPPQKRGGGARDLSEKKTTGLDKFGHMATLKLIGQRPTTHYTLDKLRDLVMRETIWPSTMEYSSQLQTGTMISELLERW